MTEILFTNVTLDYPLLGANSRSIRNRILPPRVGGVLNKNESGVLSVRALDNIDISFAEGDRVALLGPNGSGKSTLLRVASGVFQPSSGSVRRKGSIGSLIDIGLGLNPEATGRENIFLRANLLGIKKRDVDDIFVEILSFTGLGEFIDMPMRTYSSGMQMRLAFALSTVNRPEILLMDEWLSVGDESFREKAEGRLSNVLEQSKILVLASHSRSLVEKLCNRAVWLSGGSVVQDGNILDVTQEYFSWREKI